MTNDLIQRLVSPAPRYNMDSRDVQTVMEAIALAVFARNYIKAAEEDYYGKRGGSGSEGRQLS